jgi:hypothetical protein
LLEMDEQRETHAEEQQELCARDAMKMQRMAAR